MKVMIKGEGVDASAIAHIGKIKERCIKPTQYYFIVTISGKRSSIVIDSVDDNNRNHTKEELNEMRDELIKYWNTSIVSYSKLIPKIEFK